MATGKRVGRQGLVWTKASGGGRREENIYNSVNNKKNVKKKRQFQPVSFEKEYYSWNKYKDHLIDGGNVFLIEPVQSLPPFPKTNLKWKTIFKLFPCFAGETKWGSKLGDKLWRRNSEVKMKEMNKRLDKGRNVKM